MVGIIFSKYALPLCMHLPIGILSSITHPPHWSIARLASLIAPRSTRVENSFFFFAFAGPVEAPSLFHFITTGLSPPVFFRLAVTYQDNTSTSSNYRSYHSTRRHSEPTSSKTPQAWLTEYPERYGPRQARREPWGPERRTCRW